LRAPLSAIGWPLVSEVDAQVRRGKSHSPDSIKFELTNYQLANAYMQSTVSLLSCTSENYSDIYNGNDDTDMLACRATTAINKHEGHLRLGHYACRLQDLLHGMIAEAPHPEGKRYAAVAILIADHKGGKEMVELANAWLTNLFYRSRFHYMISFLHVTLLLTIQCLPFPTMSKLSQLVARSPPWMTQFN
jgi:hypothetical protein